MLLCLLFYFYLLFSYNLMIFLSYIFFWVSTNFSLAEPLPIQTAYNLGKFCFYLLDLEPGLKANSSFQCSCSDIDKMNLPYFEQSQMTTKSVVIWYGNRTSTLQTRRHHNNTTSLLGSLTLDRGKMCSLFAAQV